MRDLYMSSIDIKKLKKVKKDRITWTGSIAVFSLLLCTVCAILCINVISGSNVDFLKDVQIVEMPNLVGTSQEKCSEIASQNGLNISFERVASNKIKSGVVFYQSVDAGKQVTNNQTISVKVSSGAEIIQVPNTVGQDISYAETVLNNLGLNYKIIYTISDENELVEDEDGNLVPLIEAQTVVSCEPEAFEKAKEGDTITLYVERPYLSTTRVVPSNLYGKTWNQAVSLMDSANISNYMIYYVASDGEYGTVVSVWPKGVVSLDETVYIKVSGGPLYGIA